MKKVVIFLIIVLLLVITWQGIHLFSVTKQPMQVSEQNALRYIQNNLEISEITRTDFYHGTESFQVVEGKSNDNEEMIIWVRDTLDYHVMKRKEEGLTLKHVESFVATNLQPKELISIKLGIENSIPLYEIIYIDQYDRYSYYYIRFVDGTYLKHYHLQVNNSKVLAIA